MESKKEWNLYPESDIPYADITFTVIMKRKPLYLILNLLLPNIILVFMTVLVFVLPVSNGERAGFVVTILLAITWFLVSSIETMPSGSEGIPLFSWFLTVSLVIIVFLMICLCYSTACYYANANVVEIPLWIRYYVLTKLANYLNINTKRNIPKWKTMLEKLEKHNRKNLFKEETKENKSNNLTVNKPGKLWSSENTAQLEDLRELLGSTTIRDLNSRLDHIICFMKQQDDGEWLKSEWRIVSAALDTMFLYIFMSIFLILTFGCCVRIVYLP